MNYDNVDKVVFLQDSNSNEDDKGLSNLSNDSVKENPSWRAFLVFLQKLRLLRIPGFKSLSSWMFSTRSLVGYNTLAIVIVLASVFKAENTKEIFVIILRSLKFPVIYFTTTFILALVAFPFLKNLDFLKIWIIFLFSFMFNFLLLMNILITSEVRLLIPIFLLDLIQVIQNLGRISNPTSCSTDILK